MKKLSLVLILIIVALLATGCRSAVGDSEAANWLCEHRGGVQSISVSRNSVAICKDGTAHSTDLWREFDVTEQKQHGPYYGNSQEKPYNRD